MAWGIDHQSIFSPNWTWRGAFDWPLTMPNELDVTLVLGPLKRGWFHAFKASARNWTFSRSMGWKSFEMPRSQLAIVSFRRSLDRGPCFRW